MSKFSIYYDYDRMEEASGELMRERDNLDQCIKNMTKIIDGLPDIWGGKACEKYIRQFEDLTPGFEDTRDLIEDISKQMDSIVENVQDSDDGMAGQIGV